MNEKGEPRAGDQDEGRFAGLRRLARQILAFFGVGIIAAIVHYGLLFTMVEAFFYDPVSASLAGYVAGGGVSYSLNRLFTYEARRGHLAAGWRFAVVAATGFVLTYLLMRLFHTHWGWYYLFAQLVTTGIVLVWSFAAHKYWSFGER